MRKVMIGLLAPLLIAGQAAPTGQIDSAPLPGGGKWSAHVPPKWNGTLLLFSHGLVPPGQDNPAEDAPDPVTGGALLAAFRHKLPRYMVPAEIVVRAELPRSPNGKFDRVLLREELTA